MDPDLLQNPGNSIPSHTCTQEKWTTKERVREGLPPPLFPPTHHHQLWLARTRSRVSGLSLKAGAGDTMLSPGSPPNPIHLSLHVHQTVTASETRSPKLPPLTASCMQRLVRHRLWRRTGGLGTELWSAWEDPRTQQ